MLIKKNTFYANRYDIVFGNRVKADKKGVKGYNKIIGCILSCFNIAFKVKDQNNNTFFLNRKSVINLIKRVAPSLHISKNAKKTELIARLSSFPESVSSSPDSPLDVDKTSKTQTVLKVPTTIKAQNARGSHSANRSVPAINSFPFMEFPKDIQKELIKLIATKELLFMIPSRAQDKELRRLVSTELLERQDFTKEILYPIVIKRIPTQDLLMIAMKITDNASLKNHICTELLERKNLPKEQIPDVLKGVSTEVLSIMTTSLKAGSELQKQIYIEFLARGGYWKSYPNIKMGKPITLNSSMIEMAISVGEHLTYLNLNGRKITNNELAQIVRHCPNLTKVGLAWSKITDDFIANLPRGIKELDLHRCKITDACIANLPRGISKLTLGGCKGLTAPNRNDWPQEIKELSLFGCHNITTTCIANLPRGLKKLDVSFCTGLILPNQNDWPQGIEELKLDDNTITDDCITNLPRGLINLDIHCAGLTAPSRNDWPQEIKKLSLHQCNNVTKAFFSNLPVKLTKLFFYQCNITDDCIAKLPKNITNLDLIECQGLVAPNQNDWPQEIQRLDIVRCHSITNAFAANLPPAIQELWLNGNRSLTKDCLQLLPQRGIMVHVDGSWN